MSEESSFDKAMSEIALGRHDSDLGRLWEVIRQRYIAGYAGMRWRIAIADVEVTEDDLTMGEMRAIERRTGRTWVQISPEARAEDAVEIIRTRLMSPAPKGRGLSEKQATEIAEGLTASEVLDAIGRYSVAPDPKGDAE